MGSLLFTPITVPHGRMSVLHKAALASEILVAYAHVRMQMRRRDIREVVTSIRSQAATMTTSRDLGSEASSTAARLAKAVTRTLKALPTDTRCLSQSLVLLSLLSRRAIPGVLVIGAHTSPQFEAHAWIEYAGRPLLSPSGFSDDRLVEM